jgi:hypothetical protein
MVIQQAQVRFLLVLFVIIKEVKLLAPESYGKGSIQGIFPIDVAGVRYETNHCSFLFTNWQTVQPSRRETRPPGSANCSS